MKRVVIVQHRLLHYRVGLFQRLKEGLGAVDIDMDLVYGRASKNDLFRKDEGVLPWGNLIRNFYLNLRGVELIFQMLPFRVFTADLVVLMQENRILSNYLVILIRRLLGKSTAYWGHGFNMQSTNKDGLRERWKKAWVKIVDWWFGYTRGTASYLVNQGYDQKNITVLNNAVDVSAFAQMVEDVSQQDLKELDELHGLCSDSLLAVFCGSIYKEKKISFMLDQCAEVYKRDRRFRLIVIGAGPEQNVVERFALNNPWVKYVGVKTGRDKALYYKRAAMMLNPGLVGLHILDSFSAGVPMFTTFEALHSPEFEYLENGVNGVVVSDDGYEYAEAIIKYMDDALLLDDLSRRASEAAEIYTLENMVRNFKSGIVAALRDS